MKYLKENGTWNNQKIIKINAPIISYDELKESRHAAQRKLSYAAYIIWTELADNKDGFEWKLSATYLINECGISKNSYHRAIKELVEEKYLVEANTNYYYFNRDGAKKEISTEVAKAPSAAQKKEEPKAPTFKGDPNLNYTLEDIPDYGLDTYKWPLAAWELERKLEGDFKNNNPEKMIVENGKAVKMHYSDFVKRCPSHRIYSFDRFRCWIKGTLDE